MDWFVSNQIKNVSIDVVRICRAYKSGNSTDAIAHVWYIAMESSPCIAAYGGIAYFLKFESLCA